MKYDQIIQMAMDAGIGPLTIAAIQRDGKRLSRFAALVAAAEREACAMLAYEYPAPEPGGSWRESIAAAIRARGCELNPEYAPLQSERIGKVLSSQDGTFVKHAG